MLMQENDELNIQRCVDNELSAQELSSLLRRLDTIADGWKTLACGLLEDRRLQSSLSLFNSNPEAIAPTAPEAVTAPPEKPRASRSPEETRVIKLNEVARHWWSHPVTSLTLCAAIAFVGGLLIPDMDGLGLGGGAGRSGVASNSRTSQSPLVHANGAQQYRVELQPGGRSMEVPVVSDWKELQQMDRGNPIFSGNRANDRDVEWMVVPVEGNKAMLFPVSEDSSLDMQ